MLNAYQTHNTHNNNISNSNNKPRRDTSAKLSRLILLAPIPAALGAPAFLASLRHEGIIDRAMGNLARNGGA